MSISKPVIALDPGLLAIPSSFPNRDEAEKALRQVRQWYVKLNQEKWLNICLPGNIVKVLMDSDMFPVHANVQKLIESYGLQSKFSANDICTAINTLIQKCSKLEDLLPVCTAIHNTCVCSPDLLAEYPNLVLRDALEELLVLLASSHHCDPDRIPIRSLASSYSEDGNPQVLVKAILELADPEAIFGDASTFPLCIEQMVSVFSTTEKFLDSLIPLKVWSVAKDAHMIKLAIQLEARKRLQENNGNQPCSLSNVPKFTVGTEFYQSLRTCQASGDSEYASVTLTACAMTVIKDPRQAMIIFRQGDSQKKRSSDQSLGWRTHITERNVGLRLMCWEQSNGMYELANVGSKFELEIQDGNLQEAV